MNQNMSLLVVDDDPDDVELVIEALAELSPGMQIHTAENGEEALRFLKTQTNPLPDIIILDLRMPRLDGRKCLIAIREDNRLSEIPVVIYTTSKDVQESEDLKAFGAVYFISKPANPDEVYYLLSLVIEERWRELDVHAK